MFYYRKYLENEWKDYKLSGEEVAKILDATIAKGAKIFRHIDETLEKKGLKLSEDPQENMLRKLSLFEKAAPSYDKLANDYLVKEGAKAVAAKKQASGVS